MASIESWACEALAKLGIPDSGDIIRYLQPIENPAEVEEYLVSMLDTEQESHCKFIEDFLRKQEKAKSSVDTRYYRKPDLEDGLPVRVSEKKKQKGGGGVGGGRDNGVSSPRNSREMASSENQGTSAGGTSASGKKKTKFVNLYSDEGKNRDVVLLHGRHKCDCEASKHRLIGNCLKCGRIVCEQEGSGPCQFCGNLVVSKEEREVLNRGSKKSEALQRQLMSQKNSVVMTSDGTDSKNDALQQAIKHKNRLLEFDKTSEKRTKVYDDENDYFNSTSRWISHEDKLKLQQREEELRKARFERGIQKITIDLYGRKVIAEDPVQGIYDHNDPLIREIFEGKSNDIFSAPDREESGPKIEVKRPEYINTGISAMNASSNSKKFSKMQGSLRVQDRELQEMVDEGQCLSMHQPWASLLVAGIKRHEGRTWYSAHRGRLWIASAAKIPTPEETRQVEDMYRNIVGNDCPDFPQHYPTGCLLGCVDVVDVLPQEEYRNVYPEGESDSPYVFVCENPQEMILKFPMKGQHKIYKMDPKIHQAAKKALRPLEE